MKRYFMHNHEFFQFCPAGGCGGGRPLRLDNRPGSDVKCQKNEKIMKRNN